jgi:N utilization substance protein B
MSKSARRRAREFAVQDGTAIEAHAADVAGFDKADGELYRTLLETTIANAPGLQAALAPYIDREWNEVSPVERSILLLAACELRHCPETPYRVVINEAIELAKSYGGTDGHKFVNGVLDKLAVTLRPDEARR